MAENIDKELSEVTQQIHEALRDGSSPGKRRELAEQSIRLTTKKVLGGV
jgi:hypothetical protein